MNVESIVCSFAKGLMQAMLESEQRHTRRVATGRASKKDAPSLFAEEQKDAGSLAPHMPDLLLEEAYRIHQEKIALREDETDPEISLEHVFMASKLAHEPQEPSTQPGPGEDEAQSWLGLS
jgi:hypothetical protein